MAAPPSPPYPKGCGRSWDRTEIVTGELPGRGGFGSDILVKLPPLASRDDLSEVGKSLEAQDDLQSAIDRAATQVRFDLARATGAGGRRRLLTSGEERSITWLLDNIDVEFVTVDHIWKTWLPKEGGGWQMGREGGGWPLSQGDAYSDFAGGVCHPADGGKWITVRRGGRDQQFHCPSGEEVVQRFRDRDKIQQAFEWALQKVRCAQWGLNRVLLYKRALADWYDRDLPEFRTPPGDATPFGLDLPMVAPHKDLDLCKELGIGCPEGEEPPVDPGLDFPPCPEELCPPDEPLPPDQPDLGEPLIPDVGRGVPKKRAMSDATKGLLVVGTVGALYFGYKLLVPRA